MKKQKAFSLKARLKSFGYAFQGIRVMLKEEHNARIHLAALFLVVVFGIVLGITPNEWIALVLVSGLVLSLEAINSAVENAVDLISEEQQPNIKKVKDVLAAAVLIASLSAAVVGLIIFVPRIVNLL